MRARRRYPLALVLSMCAAVVAATCSMGPGAATGRPDVARVPAPEAPALEVTRVGGGLSFPWDLTFLPSDAMLYTERDEGRAWWRSAAGAERVVAHLPDDAFHQASTGLMGIEASPDFERTRRFYTCYGSEASGVKDVRVVLWRLDAGARHATRIRPIVTGLPVTNGQHGGCQLAFDSRGRLFVGTGDASTGTNPQDLRSGGGKVLRVDRRTGAGVQGNPFAAAANPMKRRVFSYGHRNVQGLALRPDGTMWSVEHGTYRDDEVNVLRGGGDYGWNPVPGYDESVPMTDDELPGPQRHAAWSSGEPTIATSGAAWLRGARWGAWNGSLAVSTLKGKQLRILGFDAAGEHTGGAVPPQLRHTYGRLRGAVLGPDHALYVTTSNGDAKDVILRVAPQ